MAANYKNLLKLYEQRGPQNPHNLIESRRCDASRMLREMFEQKELRPEDFDFGRLFEACYGWEWFRACRDKEIMATQVMEQSLREDAGAVSTAAFLNIAYQIVYSTTLEAYREVANVFTPLIPERQTQFLDGEKIAGVTEIGDELAVRDEGKPYAIAGVGEDWIFSPAVKDRGVEVPVTWEALFADRTGLVADRCKDVGRWGGRNREKRAIDCVIDENTTAHRYNWRGTVIATYGDNSGSHSWDNLTGTNALVDWTDIDNAEQTVNAITDPFTGEVVDVEMTELVVTKQNEQTANRILHATEIRVASPGYATTGNPTQTNVANPYLNKYRVLTSKLIAPRLATDTDWFLVNLAAYAKYMVAEKANIVMAPPNNPDEFHRRIVLNTRFNERGAYVVVQPRAAHKSTAA